MERLARNEAQVKLTSINACEDHTELYNALSRSKTLLLFVESKFLEMQLPRWRREFWMALCTNSHLVSLDLSWNRLSEECIVLLGEMLLINTALQTLDLTSCLGSSTMRENDAINCISSSLAANNTLIKLYLGRNELNDEHIKVLCDKALRGNIKLQVLSLFRNNVSNRGVQHLVDLLHAHNHTLFQVDLVLNANASRRANLELECALETNLYGQAVLALCTARNVERVAIRSALRRLPQDLTRLVSHMLTSHHRRIVTVDDDEEEDNNSEFGDHFDVSSFDHHDCRRDFNCNNNERG